MSYVLGVFAAEKEKEKQREALRDHFAGLAMQGLLGRADVFNFEMYKQDPWRVAAWAYDAADAMLAEREKKDGP